MYQKSNLPNGVPGGIRTPDLQVRSLPFYPTKLQAHVDYLNNYTVFYRIFQVLLRFF